MDTLPLGPELIRAVVDQVAIDPCGLHGLGHWARVLANGLRLAEANGADQGIVTLFALFHDSRRLSEQADPDHGPRGADLARMLHGRLFHLAEAPLHLLLTACRLHTVARTHEDLTVQTCFDADRLDLPRTGKTIDPRYLCTETAREPEIIARATAASLAGTVPDNPLGRALATIASPPR